MLGFADPENDPEIPITLIRHSDFTAMIGDKESFRKDFASALIEKLINHPDPSVVNALRKTNSSRANTLIQKAHQKQDNAVQIAFGIK